MLARFIILLITILAPTTQDTIQIVMEQSQSFMEGMGSLIPTTQSIRINYATISSFTMVGKSIKTGNICEVKPYNNGGVKRIDERPLNFQYSSQWHQMNYNQSVIYKLEDLSKLDYVLDMTGIDDRVGVLTEDGRFSTFAIGNHGEIVNTNFSYVLGMKPHQKQNQRPWGGSTHDHNEDYGLGQSLHPGIFVKDKVILYVSSQELLYVDIHKTEATPVMGYQGVNDFHSAVLSRDRLLIAAGEQGIVHYEYDENSETAGEHNRYEIVVRSSEWKGEKKIIPKDIREIPINLASTTHLPLGFLILDEEIGLVYVPDSAFSKTNQQKIIGKLLISKPQCNKLRISQSSSTTTTVYLSCPHIVAYELDRSQKNFSLREISIPILKLSPTEIIPSRKSVMVLGHSSFQVFDHCSEKIIYKGDLSTIFHHTIPVGSVFVSVDDSSIVVWQPKPNKWSLNCYGGGDLSKSDSLHYEGLIVLMRECWNGQFPQKNNKGLHCCSDSYPLNVEITPHQANSYMLQILIVLVTIWSSCALGIWLAIRHVKVNKQYKVLIEETTINESNQAVQELVSIQTEGNESISGHDNEGKIKMVIEEGQFSKDTEPIKEEEPKKIDEEQEEGVENQQKQE